ncbi:MAG: helix-turn-helix domain-containing protein [Anaerolineales bacterium]
MATQPTTDWMNLGQAAALLGVHPSTLRAWADRGEIPAHRTPGRHRRFHRSEVEAWAASRREEYPAAGQLIVESALGRARLQAVEGALRDTAWYQHLSEARKAEFREAGRRLLHLVLRYLREGDGEVNAEAEQIGIEYERLGRSAGLSLSATVEMFLFFRDFLTDAALDVVPTSGFRGGREGASLQRKISDLTNRVLLALIGSSESARA